MAIVTKFYNGSALARRRANNLCCEMVDELTAKGQGYEFFHKFAGNWVIHKLLQLRYKIHHHQSDSVARGISRSIQRSEGKIERRWKKMWLPDKGKGSNAGDRAASHLNNRPGRPLKPAQMRYCCGCFEFKNPRDWKETGHGACGRHLHDDSGTMIDHAEIMRSTRNHSCTYDSGRTLIPSENSDNVSLNNDPVHANMINVESDNDADHNNRRSDCNNSRLQRQVSSK